MKRSTANQYFSKYIILRDAIEDAENNRVPITSNFEFVLCRTCGKMIQRIGSNSHAGHYVPKGSGGGSGIYYDPRNVSCQCSYCNEYLEGNRLEYNDYMLKKYGQEVVDELRLKDKLPRPHKIDYYGIYYREAYKELKKKYGLKK